MAGAAEPSARPQLYDAIAEAAPSLGVDPMPYFDRVRSLAEELEAQTPGTGQFYRLRMASTMARMGLLEAARETVGRIPSGNYRLTALTMLAEAEAKAGLDPAKTLEAAWAEAKVMEATPSDRSGGPYAYLARSLARMSRFDEAKRAAGEVAKAEDRDEVLRDVALAEAEAGFLIEAAKTGAAIVDRRYALRVQAAIDARRGAARLASAGDGPAPVALSEMLLDAAAARDERLAAALGARMAPALQTEALKGLSPEQAGWLRPRLDLGLSLSPVEGESEGLLARARAELKAALDGLREKGATGPLRRRLTLAARVLVQLDGPEARAALLEAARAAFDAALRPALARLLYALTLADGPRGNDFVVQQLDPSTLSRRVAWLLLDTLAEKRHLDPSLPAYLRSSRGPGAPAARVARENEDLALLGLIVRRLGINPDTDVLKLVRETPWHDDAGALIDPRANPELILERLQGMKQEFEEIADRDELVRVLAGDRAKTTAFYLLYGGASRFKLINSYNSGKFHVILNVVDKLRYHADPQQAFQESLAARGFSAPEAGRIVGELKLGRFPLPGERAWPVRVDVTDSSALASVERESRAIFGRLQLGAILKQAVYLEAGALREVNGLGELGPALAAAEAARPDLAEHAEAGLAAAWRKIGQKGVLSLSLHAALNEDANPVDLKDLSARLVPHRKALAQAVRQQFKSGGMAALARDERLQLIEGKSRGKLLRYMIESALGDRVRDSTRRLLAEWEAHVDGVFQSFDELRERPESGMLERREKTLTLRYLDKREDLIASLRFADSAQCCFTSAQYRIDGHGVGNAEWISRLWKDPLSFVFMLEAGAPDDAKRDSLGFVFGSFGLDEQGAPVALLNGVYMQGKTDSAVQSILREIELRFSRPLKLAAQFVASQHGGSAKFSKEYTNETRTVRRLRALAGNDGVPETKVYDDIGLMPNGPEATQPTLWHKDLR